MPAAKPISLNVRATKSALLCFEIGGILGELNIDLGARVNAFDFRKFYALLGSIPTVPGHPARLIYDFLQIQAATQKFTLGSLRAEAAKATVNKAINSRANAFYAKYANAPAIISRMQDVYSESVTGSKPVRLAILRSVSEQQMQALREAYLEDGRTGVVRTTNSSVTATTTGSSDDETIDFHAAAQTFSSPAASVTTTGERPGHLELGVTSSTERENIQNTDYAYRAPYFENLAQYERAQISLIDEEFAQFMSGQSLPFLAAVFQNELQSIDGDVFRTQIAYLNTILMSPIDGVVTGLYKGLGESVRAGEPVLRVEDSRELLLVATLVFRGPVAIGSTIAVETALFDAPGPLTTLNGTVVSVRGLDEDDRWEVIARCTNPTDGAGKPIFPLGYHFDYDDTSVSIT
jgi:hypothetical protein